MNARDREKGEREEEDIKREREIGTWRMRERKSITSTMSRK